MNLYCARWRLQFSMSKTAFRCVGILRRGYWSPVILHQIECLRERERELGDVAHLMAVRWLRFGWRRWRFDRLGLEQLLAICQVSCAVTRFSGFSARLRHNWRHAEHGGDFRELGWHHLCWHVATQWHLKLHFGSSTWKKKHSFHSTLGRGPIRSNILYMTVYKDGRRGSSIKWSQNTSAHKLTSSFGLGNGPN